VLADLVAAVLAARKQSTMQAVQATHQTQAHRKVTAVAHHLVLQLAV
jgi:hypothetical protein